MPHLRRIVASLAIAAAAGAAGCTTAPSHDDLSVTIPYDPYNYDPDELYAEANAHCVAYGLRAVYVDETVDPNSVRWRYRHFSCV